MHSCSENTASVAYHYFVLKISVVYQKIYHGGYCMDIRILERQKAKCFCTGQPTRTVEAESYFSHIHKPRPGGSVVSVSDS